MSASIEVEIKAWADDRAELEARVRQLAEWVEEVRYRDTYFTYAHTPGYQHQRFRLREYGGRATVTAKVPVSPAAAGANQEHEFEVSNPEAFRAFCQAFGFRVLLCKEKHCRRYRLRRSADHPLHLELNFIPGLGDFIEVEALVESPEEAAAAQAEVQEVLARLGVPESRIEPTAYTRLLYDREQRS